MPRTRKQSSAGAVGGVADAAPRFPPGAPPRRLFGADLLKAAAIVGVVFIHADGIFERPSAFHEVVGDLFRFGVPVFIALYVHFACRGMERRDDAAAYLRERFLRLSVQFIVWSAIYAGLTADWGHLSPLKFLTRHWTGNGWAGQFYFIVVLQLTLLMPWLRTSGRWFAGRRHWLIVGGTLFYALLTEIHVHVSPMVGQLSDRPFFYWLPYAWLGVAWVGNICAAPGPVARAALWASVGLIPVEHLVLRPPAPTHSIYLLPSVYLASVALLSMAVGAERAGRRPPAWLQRATAVLSANTLGIFVLNPMVILLAHRLLPPPTSWTGAAADAGLSLVAWAVALAASLAITLAMKQSALGRRLVA